MKCTRSALLLLCVCCLLTPCSWGAKWQHFGSPYRAVYQVLTQPVDSSSGYYVSVPVCGLDRFNGEGVFVFDDTNVPLKVQLIGLQPNGEALVQVKTDKPAEALYAYWGGASKAPQYRGFVPGLTIQFLDASRLNGRDLRKIETYEDMERAASRLPVLAVSPLNACEWAGNPFYSGEQKPSILWMQGKLALPLGRRHPLFLAHHEAAFLAVNGETVLSRPELRHDARRLANGEDQSIVSHTDGPANVSIFQLAVNRPPLLALGAVTLKRLFVPKGRDWLLPGSTDLMKVESKGNDPCPAIWTRSVAYIAVDDLILTEVEVGSHANIPLMYRFGNGGRISGVKGRTLTVGLEPFKVEAAKNFEDRHSAVASTHHLLGDAPRRMTINKDRQRQHFEELITAQSLEYMEADTLMAYLTFMNLTDRNSAALPVARALAGQQDLRTIADVSPVFLTLARLESKKDMITARSAWNRVLTLRDDFNLIWEYIEFEMYAGLDYRQAREVLDRLDRRKEADKALIWQYRGELLLLEGHLEDANTAFLQAIQGVDNAQLQATAIQGHAAVETIQHLLDEGEWIQAEAQLRYLPLQLPEMMKNGRYALLRGKWLRKMKWQDAAILLINQSLKLNPIPSSLPELEWLKVQCLEDMKLHDQAATLRQHIVKSYPNHPVSKLASGR